MLGGVQGVVWVCTLFARVASQPCCEIKPLGVQIRQLEAVDGSYQVYVADAHTTCALVHATLLAVRNATQCSSASLILCLLGAQCMSRH